MPALKNLRHERFAQEIALGASPRAAYISVGFKDSAYSRPNASKLKHSPHVSARIAELLHEWGDACGVQLSWIQHELLAIAEGRAVSRTSVNSKGERFEEWDRLAALNALLKSVGVGEDTNGKTVMALLEKRIAEWSDDDLRVVEMRLLALAQSAPAA
jgi:phage terminase small subunit